MSLGSILEMDRTHEVIHEMVMDFATEAWDLLSQGKLGLAVALSFKEYTRFCRAFYRVELFYTLFRRQEESDLGMDILSEIQDFLSRHPPWENEQLACVHDFLEKKLSRGELRL